ncbi:hypothetical protein [Pseudomonas spelaei]
MPTPLPSVANTISALFASRPRFDTVVQNLLTAMLTDAYPGLNLDLAKIQLATPEASGGWRFEPLMTHVLNYLASGPPLPVNELDLRAAFLSGQPPRRLNSAAGLPLDMQRIITLIRELPWSVPIALQNALSDYWNENDEASHSRWRRLSTLLLDSLQISVLKQADLTDLERDTLQQVINCPDGDQRMARHGLAQTHAYALETTLHSDTGDSVLLGSHLLLVRTVDTQVIVLLCKPGGRVEHFPSVDAFGQYWGAQLADDYRIDTLSWRRYEIQGDVFDQQAALILNRQLKSLEALRLPCTLGLTTLRALHAELSDPAQYLIDTPAGGEPQFEHLLRPQLPDWLQRASPTQQQAYRQHSMGLAACKILNKGRTFLSDITDIQAFTLDRLRQALRSEEQRTLPAGATPMSPEHYDPDKITLTFTEYAGYPGAPGIVEITHMSLTELALKNLVGRPRGTLTLAHRDGLDLPDWLTADFVTDTNGLIETVNIGRHYPEFLKQQLLGDAPAVEARMRLFAEQMRHQLPLQALELHLQQQDAIGATGARYVAALVEPGAAERRVDEHTVVIRCLALLRKAEAVPDVVANMFIIEPLDNSQGPHLLYRPLYPDALCEFPTRAALLNAIAQPGPLQTSVLTWLSDEARPIYDNGGFLHPHYVRFGQGDEFSNLLAPPPARLANDGASNELLQYLLNGQVMEYLYGSNARALVDQATHQSMSTRSSRWAAMLEIGGVLFNTLLLPLLRGPALLTAWLLALTASLQRDVPMLGSADPTTRELAAADVLMNLANVLGELVPGVESATPLALKVKKQALRMPAPRRLPQQWPRPKAPTVTEGVVVMPGEFPGERSSALELDFASARRRLTATQKARLARLQVPRPPTLPSPVLNGPRRGLYVLDNRWHVLIERQLYRVNLLEDGNVLIVDPLDSRNLGPYVKADDQGRWDLDLTLRLRGGMPLKRVAAQRQRKAQRKIQLTDQYNDFLAQQVALQRAADVSQSVMEKAAQDPRFTAQQRAGLQRQFDTALERQTRVFQQLLDTLDERIEHGIALSADTVLALRENTLNNARKAVVRAEQDREQLYASNRRFIGGGLSLRQVIMEHYVSYLAFIKELAQINERSLRNLELRDRQLAALYEQGPEGVAVFERLTRDRPENELSTLGVVKLQLLALRLLSIKDAALDLMDGLNAIVDPLSVHVRSHSELKTLELTAVERRETLESLVERYGQALDGLQGLREVNAEELESGHFNALYTLVEKLYEDATQQLANEVKPAAQTVRKPPKRPKIRAGRAQKKLIRTRSGAMLIGDLAPAGSSLPIDVVEVRSEDNNQVIATYSRHEEDLWDEVRMVRTPEPPAAARPLNELKGKARKLLKQLEGYLQGAERYKALCRHPQEIEELMSNEATRLDNAAQALDQALGAQPAETRLAADQRLLEDLRQGVARLTRKGHELRTALSLELPPTSGNLQFLFDQGLVQVAMLGERIALTGARKDFIQEYAINDRRGYPLWYAHFHYGTAHTPKADYSVAHLKTAAQRRQSYYTLLDNAQSPQAVVAVHRGMLGTALAERWFLPLAP